MCAQHCRNDLGGSHSTPHSHYNGPMHGLRMSWPETNTCAYAEGFAANMSAPVVTQSMPKRPKEDHC